MNTWTYIILSLILVCFLYVIFNIIRTSNSTLVTNEMVMSNLNIMIVLIPVLIYSIWLMRHKVKYSATTTATVVTSSCTTNTTGTTTGSVACILTLKYTVNNIVIISPQISTGTSYSAGQSLSIRYDPFNPTDFTLTSLSSHFVGIVIFLIDLLIIILLLIYCAYQFNRINYSNTIYV